MSLPGGVQSAIPWAPGFDCDSPIPAALAVQFYNLGYKFCIRYISRGPESSQDLTEQEATEILNAGLALMPVQHAHKQGWSPNPTLGQQDGQEAAVNAQVVGFPDGVTVWCDLEGVNSSAQAPDVIGYCKAWYGAVSIAGYAPGLYVGAGAILTGQQLYALPFQHYWRSQSRVPDIPNRGYQIIQLSPSVRLNGMPMPIDFDIAQNDNEDGAAQWIGISVTA